MIFGVIASSGLLALPNAIAKTGILLYNHLCYWLNLIGYRYYTPIAKLCQSQIQVLMVYVYGHSNGYIALPISGPNMVFLKTFLTVQG